MFIKYVSWKGLAAIILLSWVIITPHSARSQGGEVHLLLFYSPECSHCHDVIYRYLPPLFEKYGEQLVIEYVNISTQEGKELFTIVKAAHGLEIAGIPTLAVGDLLLIGSVDISHNLPGLVDKLLKDGGVGWPDVPGILEALQVYRVNMAATATPTSRPQAPTQPAVGGKKPGASQEANQLSPPWVTWVGIVTGLAFTAALLSRWRSLRHTGMH